MIQETQRLEFRLIDLASRIALLEQLDGIPPTMTVHHAAHNEDHNRHTDDYKDHHHYGPTNIIQGIGP